MNPEQPTPQVQVAGEEPREAGQQDRRQSHEVSLRNLDGGHTGCDHGRETHDMA